MKGSHRKLENKSVKGLTRCLKVHWHEHVKRNILRLEFLTACCVVTEIPHEVVCQKSEQTINVTNLPLPISRTHTITRSTFNPVLVGQLQKQYHTINHMGNIVNMWIFQIKGKSRENHWSKFGSSFSLVCIQLLHSRTFKHHKYIRNNSMVIGYIEI